MIKYILLSLAVMVAAAGFSAHAVAGVGATVPFTSYEGEAGVLGGGATVVALTSSPTTQYSSPQLEASGHAYVQLTAVGQSVTWTNTTAQSFTAINLRSCIPDAPTGGGITSTINLYVNGEFRQAFSVNSLQNYCYEGTNYNGQTDKNPADGHPRGFWNDTHAFIVGAAIGPNDTLTFQKDSTNAASFYYIDVADLENPPLPLTQPANSLSILTYGAISNNTSVDNTSAINACFTAARSQGKSAWIPPGTYSFSAIKGGLNASGITISGAGPWYSTLYRVVPNNNSQGVANMITTTSSTLQNVMLDCNASSRAGNNNNGAVNFSGTNWVVNNVWITHATSAFWCAGVNGIAENCRVLSVWSDGGNFNNVQSANGIGMNLTYSNNFVRGTGDDAMAINSVHYNVNGTTTNFYTIMSNIAYVNNTAIAPWGGKCIGIYGGVNDLVTNNLFLDTARYIGLGVMKFGVNGSDLVSATVMNNVVIRCGGNGYSQQQQAMMIGNGGDGQGVGLVANAYCSGNIISNSLYDAVGFSTGTNITFQHNTIINPGLDAIAIGPPDLGSAVMGNAIINSNAVIGLPANHFLLTNSASRYAALVPTAAANSTGGANLQTENCIEGGTDVITQNGSYASYGAVNFANVNTFVARVSSAEANGVIQIHLDSTNGALVGTCVLPATGGSQIWTNQYCQISGASGVHAVYLVFTNDSVSTASMEFFGFYSAAPVPSHHLVIGNTYSFKSLANNEYVTAANGGSSALIASSASVGATQEFKILDAGSGNIGFQSLANNDIVTADNSGSSPLIANRMSIGSWETFTEVDAGNGNVGFLANADGKYVTAPNSGAGSLIASSTSVSTAESFTPAVIATTPPTSPVLAGNPANSEIFLNWSAPATAASYNLKRSLTDGGPYTIIQPNTVSLSYADTNVSNGTLYYYVVSALNSAGESSNSTQVAIAPGVNSGIRFEGDLIVNLQSGDLNASSAVWTNHTSNTQGVGNFTALSGVNLNVAPQTWNGQTVSALFVNASGNNSAQSALVTPAEIASNGAVSVESWIYPVDVNATSCYFNYGYQGGSSSPMNEREFNCDTSGHGIISGNFGNLDTSWGTKIPVAGAWHHVAITYNGSTLLAYLDGSLAVTHAIGTRLATVPTLMQVGSAIAGTGVNGGNDPFHGYIACVRVESGVLTSGDVAANYASGLLATPVASTPAGLVATAGDGQVALMWSPSGNATNYNVKRSMTVNGTYTLIATNWTKTSFTNTGLANGTTYYFTVSATNSAGGSADSAAVNAEPISKVSPQVNLVAANGQLQLAWPQDHLGWMLQVQTNSLGMGLNTNWVTVSGSDAVNQMTFPVTTNGSSFFRLVSP
ncbi:MAG TPA: carbohydrate-binding protein [Verrucomicrobiae bacterium]|jgi:hypothetical protein|nr:carbohydrate-binding protein [Verrucomicrobiae bacterium]